MKKKNLKRTPYQKIKIEVVKESSPKEAPQVANSRSVFDMMYEEASKQDRECFWVIPLTGKNHIIGINLVSMGCLTSSIIHPREVFKSAILANAANIILVHNHPSGDPTPSHDDKEVTKRLKDAGDILGIKVLDHIIVGGKRYSSLEDGDWTLENKTPARKERKHEAMAENVKDGIQLIDGMTKEKAKQYIKALNEINKELFQMMAIGEVINALQEPNVASDRLGHIISNVGRLGETINDKSNAVFGLLDECFAELRIREELKKIGELPE
jgi:DNA repair protein RadC